MALDKVERGAEDDRTVVRAVEAFLSDKLGLLVRAEREADPVQGRVGSEMRQEGERAPQVVGHFAAVQFRRGDGCAGAPARVDDGGAPAESALGDGAGDDREDVADVRLVRASGQSAVE